jgi:7,8-dihydro-6-hydroxymethylpterin-pyrophosphokinase
MNQNGGLSIRVFLRSCAQIEEREERGEKIEEKRKRRVCQIDILPFVIV